MGKPLNFAPKRQRGAVMFIALIALVAMMLAGIALMRSIDTANVIAGNFAFKQAGLNATDIGMEAANSAVLATLAAATETTTTTRYLPVASSVAATSAVEGLPDVDWRNVTPDTTTFPGYQIQYVVERLCQAVPAASGVAAQPNGPTEASRSTNSDIEDNCLFVPQMVGAGGEINNDVLSQPPSSVAGDIYYRITTRVTGPRGTVSVAQSLVAM